VVIPLTILIAFSRMYLYVHFPTDILGGAVLGITIGALTYVYGTKILKIKKE
jgi:undecaprenyl-diphosphatase